MNLTDTLRFATGSLTSARKRSLLMIIAMAIGVAAVVILTALGEGARLYVIWLLYFPAVRRRRASVRAC
jgi:putative ABC transport system permease protein